MTNEELLDAYDKASEALDRERYERHSVLGSRQAYRDARAAVLARMAPGASDPDAAINLTEALVRIVQWADAYPLKAFPEPDESYYAKAHEVLTAHGMTLDRLSAAAMRHVVEGVGKIARDALAARPASEGRADG